MTIEFFAIQNHKGKWYSELGVEKNWNWQKDITSALIYTREECAKQKIEDYSGDYPSQPIPKLIKFECQKPKQIDFIPEINKGIRESVGNCKFCGAIGYKSDQGGIDGIPEWEVYAAHKEKCPVKKKGQLQGEVTWVPLSDWSIFYKIV